MIRRLNALLIVAAATFAPSLAPAVDSAASLIGRWQGSYLCNWGRTGVLVTIAKAEDPAFEGELAFYPLPEEPNLPRGRFTIAGTFDIASRILVIHGVSWLERPQGYEMVDVTGMLSVDGRTVVGTIDSASCSDFRVLFEGKEGLPGQSKTVGEGRQK
jgi:hypothetical protein